jgi:hypothetical protein
MKISVLIVSFFLAAVVPAAAQPIRVNPTGVNVNSQDPTVVFLTFGRIPQGYRPAEALWCGRLVAPPPPALGLQCDPATVYGSLPARYDLSKASGDAGLTDIMSIPPSVVRRAYMTAESGGGAGFFYVRRFVSDTGQPDQYVAVTCRMTGGGARVPFALTNVEIRTGSDEPVLFIRRDLPFPKLHAEIKYNGTGRLKGRWELVRPGEEPPTDFDLLTEASLPLEQRANQKRYLQVARFNHFLPPGGSFNLPLEAAQSLPIEADGQYILLLRIESTDDKESDSDLRAIGVGDMVVHSGGAAGFPMPILKFFVGPRDPKAEWERTALNKSLDAVGATGFPIEFTWAPFAEARFYRLELFGPAGDRLLSALLLQTPNSYRAPSWLNDRMGGVNLHWRVVALDSEGRTIAESNSRSLRGAK